MRRFPPPGNHYAGPQLELPRLPLHGHPPLLLQRRPRDHQLQRRRPADLGNKASFSSTSPRFNLLHKWNEGTSTYATAAKGFRSGGFNSDDSTFDAEDLRSYELGTKAALMGGRLYLDGAVYYLDYKNRQSQNVVGLFAVTTNGGKASGPGIELAMTSRLDHGLELDLSLSYNDVKYDQTTFETDEGERFNYVSGAE